MLDPERTPPADVLAALPVFPLPNVVFLPGMVLPLNVFEPRYLALVDHVLRGGMHVGVPLLRPGPAVVGRPPTFEPIFGVGRLTSHQRLPDGRRFVRLEGLGRVETVEELPQEHEFRRVRARALPEDPPGPGSGLPVLMAQIERMARTFDDDDREMVCSILRLDDPRVVIYAVVALLPNVELFAAELGRDPGFGRPCPYLEFQQQCLAAPDPDARVDLLLARAATVLSDLGESGRFPVAIQN
jgi:Lon protease-like protein